MPDYPPAAAQDAEAAIRDEIRSSREIEPDRLARAALDAAWPHLADAVAKAILAHMEAHEPAAMAGAARLRQWRRDMHIAAQVAGLAFFTRDDKLRMTAEAMARGDCIACDIPEVPS